jgi:ABC-type cobalamin/Fe3+-siderophores transport system ATPase subunit
VELRGVSVVLDGSVIVRDVSLEAGPGGLHLVIGPNGAGKTTLLKAIAGVAPFTGVIRLCGLAPRDAARLVSFSPSAPAYDPWARVVDVIEAGLYNSGEGAGPGSVMSAAKALGVEGFLYRRFGELSSGEQKLVDLARSLARNPRVLVLDEPLAFLDMRNQARVLRLLKELSRSVTIIASMHELYFVDYSDQVVLLDGGSAAYHGPPDGLPVDLVRRVYGSGIVEARLGGRRLFLPEA